MSQGRGANLSPLADRGRAPETSQLVQAMNLPGLTVSLLSRAKSSPLSHRPKTFKILFASFSSKKKKTFFFLLYPIFPVKNPISLPFRH
jgi:hypothetical protein